MSLPGPPLDERSTQALLLVANGLPTLRTTRGWRLIPSMTCEGSYYLIDPRSGECSCSDRHYRQRTCKHELAARLQDVIDAAAGWDAETTLPF